MSKFKIPIDTAMMHIQNLKNEIQEAYGITVHDDTSIPINSGVTSDGPTGTFNVRINQPIRLEGLFHKQANTMDFVDYIRILHHEEQHIVQAITDVYIQDAALEQDVDSIKQMSIKNIACIGNYDYYRGSNHSYNNNLAEIDAEYTAISNTYDFLRNYVSPKYAEQMICDVVNQKVLHSDYFIQKVCSNFDDIADAFSDKYEQAKFSHIYHPVVRLRPSQNVNQDSDEYIKYLQQVVKDDPNNMWLMEQFWNVTDVDEKDKMVASIVLHIHPELTSSHH